MTGTDGDPPERPVGRLTPKQAAKRAKYQEREARRDIRRLAKKHRSRPRRWLVRFAKIVVWFVCLVTVGIVILAVFDPQPASTTTSTFAPVVTVGSATTRPRPSTTVPATTTTIAGSSFDAAESRCIEAIAMEFTSYMESEDCQGILGADWCQALLAGADWRLEQGQSIHKLERVYSATC